MKNKNKNYFSVENLMEYQEDPNLILMEKFLNLFPLIYFIQEHIYKL